MFLKSHYQELDLFLNQENKLYLKKYENCILKPTWSHDLPRRGEKKKKKTLAIMKLVLLLTREKRKKHSQDSFT